MREQHGTSLVTTLRVALREQRLLVVLDNLEHVVVAAPALAGLLADLPGLKALVTSREALRLSGEHVVVVAPLAVPEPTTVLPTTQLMQYAAVRLFVERAQAVAERFGLTDANAAAVAAICARLDGLPLAIELAAARVPLFPAATLLARLERRLPVLTRGPCDLLERQQTLRNTIDWSYGLLNAGERTLFARLGVFVGGFTLETAEAVCTVEGKLGSDVLDGLAALVDKSLVRQDEGLDGEPRIMMLETIALLRHRDIFGPVRQRVRIAQKTVKYSPTDKLYHGLIALLAGAHGLVEVTTRLRSDHALHQAFGRSACAEQSLVQQTLDACTAENVQQMEQALAQIYRQHSQSYRHDYQQRLAILDADRSGLPCGKKAAFATKGYFARQRNRQGRQLGRVVASHYDEVVVERVFAGATHLVTALPTLMLAAEQTLELEVAKRARTIVRVDAAAAVWTLATGWWAAALR